MKTAKKGSGKPEGGGKETKPIGISPDIDEYIALYFRHGNGD